MFYAFRWIDTNAFWTNFANAIPPIPKNQEIFGNLENDYPHLSVTTSSPKGNRQEVSVHVGNYFM